MINPNKISERLISFINKTPSSHCWSKIGIKDHYGVCLPLSSLHSEHSCGIGEFNDLIPMIFWCKKIGFDILQLLPLNDSGEDNSPYNGISAFALNPCFLSITALPRIEKIPDYQEKIKSMQELTKTPTVRIRIVQNKKVEFLKEYYEILKNEIREDNDFRNFKEEQKYWLFPYTLFRSIKETRHWAPFKEWPEALRNLEKISPVAKNLQPLMEFHAYIQYLCFLQLSNIKKIALQNQVFIKGDIPILISKDSCESWYYKDFFLCDDSAGAPPDAYNKNGQNWQFPLYNWKALKNKNFVWWKNRLKYAENFYSIYRLDHIAGFFRIWALSNFGANQGTGRFIPAKEKEWLIQGNEILKALLSFSDMLPIGEDLGMVPSCIKQAIKNLGICGTAIPRWEREWNKNGDYIPIDQYSPLSMTSLSSHDSDTLSLWWTNNPEEARLYAKENNLKYSRLLSKDNHKSIIQKTFLSPSLFHINLINDYLALKPSFTSKDPSKERINRPGIISPLNWVYRMIPSIEELLNDELFNNELSSLLPEYRF